MKAYRFGDLIRRLADTGKVFLCAPDGTDQDKLRAYAYGGLLCRIPLDTAPRSEIKMPSIVYTSPKYMSAADRDRLRPYVTVREADDSMAWPRGNRAKLEIFENCLDGLLAAMRTWSLSNQRERGIQTQISLSHRDYSAHGAVVCDFEHCIPERLYLEGFDKAAQAGLLSGIAKGKKPECDFITFSVTAGRPVFSLIELKCNRTACTGSAGLSVHANDMLAVCHIPGNGYKLELLHRLRLMMEYGLVFNVPADLEDLAAHPEQITLCRGFLFTEGAGLRSQARAAGLCSRYIPVKQREYFFYQFRGTPQEVSLSAMEPWHSFSKSKTGDENEQSGLLL